MVHIFTAVSCTQLLYLTKYSNVKLYCSFQMALQIVYRTVLNIFRTVLNSFFCFCGASEQSTLPKIAPEGMFMQLAYCHFE